MNAEGKEATEGDLERAMKSCDDLARENDYLRARLKDNPDVRTSFFLPFLSLVFSFAIVFVPNGIQVTFDC